MFEYAKRKQKEKSKSITPKKEQHSGHVMQLKRQEVSIQGLTHMVRKKGGSIFDGQEIPPPFGQLVLGERLVIDDEKFEMSRRGIHQEDDQKRAADKVGPKNQKWYQILKVKGSETRDKDFYIREGTFLMEKEQTDSDIVTVEEMHNLLNNVLPVWANIHRALEFEAEEFRELSKVKAAPSQTAEKIKIYGDKKDNSGIADLICGMSPGGKRLHLGSMKTEKTREGRVLLRVYLTIISEQQVKRDGQNKPYTDHKDIQQEPGSGKIQIYGVGQEGSPEIPGRTQVIFFNIGKPARAYGWVEKYIQQEAKKGIVVNPVVRSFLVPLDELEEVLFGASNEHEGVSPDVSNVDFDRVGNQFGMQKGGLQILQDKAVPGSMITYGDGIDALDKTSGMVCSLSALREETGIPDIKLKRATLENDDPKAPGFRPARMLKETDEEVKEKVKAVKIQKGGAEELERKKQEVQESIILGSAKKRPSSLVADELQNYYAHWKGRKVFLTAPEEAKPRKEQVKKFLTQQYITDSRYSQPIEMAVKANMNIVLNEITNDF